MGAPGRVPGGIRGRCPQRTRGGQECPQPGFQIPQGTEVPRGHGTEGLAALGNPLHLSRGKPPAVRDLAGAREASRHAGSTFPAQPPLNRGRFGPGPWGCARAQPVTPLLVSPPPLPLPCGSRKDGCDTDQGWARGQDGPLSPKTFVGR